MKIWLGAAALLLLVGCDGAVRPRQATPIYAGWEEGLTLVYESPDLPQAERFQRRLQVRVVSSKDTAQGREVESTYSTFQGELRLGFTYAKGGSVLRMQGLPDLPILPEGFPDKVSRWASRNTQYEVVGRASVVGRGLKLPAGHATDGVWVEARTPDGLRRRTLYLQDVGEVESCVFADGQWKTVNRLVSRGFSEVPRFAK